MHFRENSGFLVGDIHVEWCMCARKLLDSMIEEWDTSNSVLLWQVGCNEATETGWLLLQLNFSSFVTVVLLDVDNRSTNMSTSRERNRDYSAMDLLLQLCVILLLPGSAMAQFPQLPSGPLQAMVEATTSVKVGHSCLPCRAHYKRTQCSY